MFIFFSAELNDEGKVAAQIVIGTAGTINTLMRKTRQIEFNHIKLFVVDEVRDIAPGLLYSR